MTLLDAIQTRHQTIAAQVPGGIWLGSAPSGVSEPPPGQFKAYTEFATAPASGESQSGPPPGATRERFFGLTHTDGLLILVRGYALGLDGAQVLGELLHDTFDGADLATTDATFLSLLAVHRPLYEDLGVLRDGDQVYRATIWFECRTQD